MRRLSVTSTLAASSSTPITAPSPQSTSNWRIEESTNTIDGAKTTILENNQGTAAIVIRFRDKTLDAYVATPEMVGYNHASVRIRFDDGAPLRQNWSRSEDYKALFSPDPRGFLARLQASKVFYIEYEPYEKVPETLTFDVGGLVVPKTVLDEYDQRQKRYRAAWQKKFDSCFEESRNSPSSKYEPEYWTRKWCGDYAYRSTTF